MEPKKILFFSTLSLILSIFIGAASFQIIRQNAPISLDTNGFPSIGQPSAKVEVVLIEDFQCKNCREFSRKILPDLQRQYVKEGKIRFTLVPVAFLAGSQVVANAVMEVFYQNPRHFFPYLQEILHYDGEIKVVDLVRIARRMNGINLDKLHLCIEQGCHNRELQKNLNWAQGIMGSQFRTPALYINGAIGSTHSFEAIKYQIDQNLGDK